MKTRYVLTVFSLLVAGFIPERSAAAHDAYLVSREFVKIMPDGLEIPMWGYAEADSNFVELGPPSSPGPLIRVPEGEEVLNIHLRNELPVPTSVILPAVPAAPAVVRDGSGRVVSFGLETLPGGEQVYSFPISPGTFIYHSGTHVQVQVQMGLLGAAVKNFAPGQAYGDDPLAPVENENEAVLVYSEIDPALHFAVAGGDYGPGKGMTSTIDYRPRYFFINGETAPDAAPIWDHDPVVGERILVRFVNGGLKVHAPLFDGIWGEIVAEDGNPLPFARETYSVLVSPGQTVDFLFDADQAESIPIFDRRLYLVSGDLSGRGMLVYLDINEPLEPVAAPLSFSRERKTLLLPAGAKKLGGNSKPNFSGKVSVPFSKKIPR